jgi:hypothetical protein
MMRPGRMLRAPASKAALIQVLALLPTVAIVWLLARLGVALSVVTIALLQGAIAALIACKVNLALWWRAIELLFPLALLETHALHLPPVIFLLLFVLLLGVYWSTFRTQVPFYPSSPSVWNAVAQLLPQRPVRLIDIGSGLGGLVLALARKRPDSAFFGIELAPLPWLFSCLRARLAGSTARFVRGDYERLDFSAYDVVFAYLSPAAMEALWCKAQKEMRPGTMLLSYEFLIGAKAPDQVIAVTPCGPALYVWHF